jgi:hypothetical protein
LILSPAALIPPFAAVLDGDAPRDTNVITSMPFGGGVRAYE